MLDRVGGAGGFRTQIRNDEADGSKTILRTRGGMPEFVTTKDKRDEPTKKAVYVGERLYNYWFEDTLFNEVYEITVQLGRQTVRVKQLDLDKYLGNTGEDYKKYHRCYTWKKGRNVLMYSSPSTRYSTSYKRMSPTKVVPVEWKGVKYEASRTGIEPGSGAVIDVTGYTGQFAVVTGATHYTSLTTGVLAEAYGYTYSAPPEPTASVKFWGSAVSNDPHFVRSPDGEKLLFVEDKYGNTRDVPEQIIEWHSGVATVKHTCSNHASGMVAMHPDAYYDNYLSKYVLPSDYPPPPMAVANGYVTFHAEHVISANYESDGGVTPILLVSDTEVSAINLWYPSGTPYSESVDGRILSVTKILRGNEVLHEFTEYRSQSWQDVVGPADPNSNLQSFNWLNFPEEHVHLIINREYLLDPYRSFTQVFLHDFKHKRVFHHKFPEKTPSSGDIKGPFMTAPGAGGSTRHGLQYLYGEPVFMFEQDVPDRIAADGYTSVSYPYSRIDSTSWRRARSDDLAYLTDGTRFAEIPGSLWADDDVILCSIYALEPGREEHWTVVVFRKTGKLVIVDKPFGFQHLYRRSDKVT